MAKPHPTSGVPARETALWMLERVIGHGALISELLSDDRMNALAPQERARTQRLATEVLANIERADRLIKQHVPKNPPLWIHNVLRLGTVELAQGEAAYGVVNDLVQIASKHRRHNRLKGLVNAVLRKLSSHAEQDWAALPPPRLPNWLRQPLVQAWGRKTVVNIERAHADGAPVDLTLQGRSTDTNAFATTLKGDVLPTGSIRLRAKGQISALPGYADGHWWVQDAAAAIPARLVRGQKVLDLCAAPGGKTMQMASDGRDVTAVDVSDARMRTLKSNLERTKLTAELLVSAALDVEGAWDTVLLDAPCSATGTIRRHPDLPYAKDGSEFGFLIEQQAALLDHAVSLTRPGGQIVFCTCSLLPDEGEVQIEEALERHPDLEIDADALNADWIEADWRSPEGGLRLRPDMWADRGGLDGFYIAALKKAG